MPRANARRSTGPNRATTALTVSGNSAKEQSCTVTTLGTRTGGTTKLVACSTCAPGSQRSTRGRSVAPHADSAGRTGSGTNRVPAGASGRSRPDRAPSA